MDYEKEYKEALERARRIHNQKVAQPFNIMADVFHELAESEDERIRKWLIELIKSTDTNHSNMKLSENCKLALAYLEKQKVQPTDTKTEQVIKAARRVLNNWLDDTACPDVSGDFAELEYAIREYDGEEEQKEQKGSLRVIKDASEWEKIKEQKPADMMFTFNDVLALGSAMDLARGDKKLYGTLKSILGRVYDAYRGEQQPSESDSIKGGDFISDGKRVFLVLANVEERNFGEIGSSYCESLILGVDGVVYCDGEDFKKYKRATSDERAKFIHDLKCGVKLKEQPAEWSEEHIADIFEKVGLAKIAREQGNDELTNALQDAMLELSKVESAEWSEEDEKMLRTI